jgi:hypothetical protein
MKSFLLVIAVLHVAFAQYPGLEPREYNRVNFEGIGINFHLNRPTASCSPSNLLPYSVIQPGFCPTIWASGLAGPRALEVASNGDILTVESDLAQVTVLWDDNNNG